MFSLMIISVILYAKYKKVIEKDLTEFILIVVSLLSIAEIICMWQFFSNLIK